ncbi:3-oxo-5-alpha-steroid 4-dehydrogenase-domain-containing protein [Tricharina praecox]|uniref:3-oxo-5-alpha-steroid 4-dehydrogenase-domain-containing protein n=1 Tax=Tricharina praecox TaxID=43433 RepID=UPI0022201A43|nr:3-oxo-5-alpha-steroid 4-dehydrogenase-domain-containing protein [Tricharina praecox]KAI5845414.1 3-oxo-5-alpha-steroid 4-dehydrogenase-domain-containing protein [Tricharina praecox]
MDNLQLHLETALSALHTARAFLSDNGIAPLTLKNWHILLSCWKYFPLVLPLQLLLDWYPMGKTSSVSLLNVRGKPAWVLMELLSPSTLLYSIYSNPTRPLALPRSHVWLTTLYLMHYFHRALLSPLRNPAMADMHIVIAVAMGAFNLLNGTAIGAWLGGYGSAEETPSWMIALGSAMFLAGLWGNVYHEEVLRDIRRETAGSEKKVDDGETVVSEEGRVYKIPHGGLFAYCWHPHYFSEWIEWTGFMIAGGGPANFVPAAIFLVNEIATMGPRALQGRRWYLKKFGDKAPVRKAVVPGLL